MHRCYAAPKQWTADGGVRLSAGEARHVAQVLRLQDGDSVEVFDGHGRVARGRLAVCDAEEVTVRIEETMCMPAAPLSIALVQALPKGRGMDLIVEKATEIGVHAIYPVLTDRCVAQPGNEKAQQRVERWQRIARSAAKQCGTNWLPDIHPIARLDDVLVPGAFDCLLAGTLAPGLRMLHAVVTELRAAPPRRLGIAIGPEGDLSPKEIERIVELGGAPVCFGGNVLRVETAAIFALSILAYELLWPR